MVSGFPSKGKQGRESVGDKLLYLSLCVLPACAMAALTAFTATLVASNTHL